jgi:hypothetical protein
MLRIVAVVCALVLAGVADADVGIGVSAKTDNATIYVPIVVGRFTFEPYVRATDQQVDSSSSAGTAGPLTSQSTAELDAHVAGVGIFRLIDVAERVTFYYGGRLARVDEEAISVSVSNPSSPIASPRPDSSKVEGHSVAPTIGFQYRPIERLSIGAKIAVERAELDAVSINSSPFASSTQTSTSDIVRTDTRGNVILRFFF